MTKAVGLTDQILRHCICRLWPIATDRILVAVRRFRGITDMAGAAAGRTRTRMTHLYGPAVCCKSDVSDGGIGLALLYPARE
jgi:hypothetical protein